MLWFHCLSNPIGFNLYGFAKAFNDNCGLGLVKTYPNMEIFFFIGLKNGKWNVKKNLIQYRIYFLVIKEIVFITLCNLKKEYKIFAKTNILKHFC